MSVSPTCWNATLCGLQSHCPLKAHVFRDNVCAHNRKYADESWHLVGWRSPANINWQASLLSILPNGSACLPTLAETGIFMKPPLLQISCCWHKFVGIFQALIYDLCMHFLHSNQHSSGGLSESASLSMQPDQNKTNLCWFLAVVSVFQSPFH